MSPLNILHVSTAITWRGGEQQIAYLIDELQQQPAVDIRQTVVCVKNSELHQYCIKKSISHVALKRRFNFDLLFAYQLKKNALQKQVQLVHLHDAGAHNFAVLAADIFGHKTPLILARRVNFPIRNNRYSRYKYNHTNIQKIICVSKSVAQIMAANIQQKNKLTTIYSGIQLAKFSNLTHYHRLRKTYKIAPEKWLIGNVAALTPEKDYYTFIDTAKLLIEKGMPIHFFMIGEGNERMGLTRYIQQLGLENNITLTGFREDIPEILPELDVFLFTSITEGLGTTVLDALACKVPVVATKVGGVPEMLEHEVTGLLAPVKSPVILAKQVVKVLNNKVLKEQLVHNGFEKVQQFSKKNMAVGTLKVYQKLIKLMDN